MMGMKTAAQRLAATKYDRQVPVVSIRLIRRDYRAVCRLARRDGTTLSRFVRQLVTDRLLGLT